MPYLITGTATFSSQANRDAALTRVNAVLPGFSYSEVATTFQAGVKTPTATTITFSLMDGEDGAVAAALSKAIYDALIQSNRQTSGYLSVNYV